LHTREERQKQLTPVDAESDERHDTLATWMHCSVGPKMENVDEDNEDGKQQTAQLHPARGFDRLAAVGFSESDIANFRRQFHSQTTSNFLDDQQFETEEEYDEHARVLEERWIDSMDNPGTASLSQSGAASNSTIIEGVVAGFFFPLLPLFFMRKPIPPVFWEEHEHESPDSVIFSRTMQIGLVAGLLSNLLFGLWRYLLDG